MLSFSKDVTTEFNANNGIAEDVSQWQICTIHVSGSISGTVSITGTNDPGAIQGVSDGGAWAAANGTAIQATNLADGSAVTAIAAAGNYRITVSTKFILVGGADAATDGKVILFFNSPT